MPRSLPTPYRPAASPAPSSNPGNIIRAVWDEFYRISNQIIALGQPVAVTLQDSDTIPIGTVAVWERLFLNTTPTWDVPGGNFDPVTGEWTSPQRGLFDITCIMTVQPFGIGNKNYYAGLRVVKVFADGSPDVVYEITDGGVDDIPLGVTIAIAVPMLRGDKLYFEGTAVHENQVGTVDVDVLAQILRVSDA